VRQAPGRVTRLALLDTSAAPDDESRTVRRTAGIASAKAGRFVGVSDRLLPRLVHASHVAGPVGKEVKSMAVRVGAEAFLRQQQAIRGRPDSRPLLSMIQVPTLVAVGDGDVLTPLADSLEIQRGVAGSRLHVFKDCGHLPALEQPAETSGVLREWLAA
jgi:pimeloyl-ACP methyl ester carboxylesterase